MKKININKELPQTPPASTTIICNHILFFARDHSTKCLMLAIAAPPIQIYVFQQTPVTDQQEHSIALDSAVTAPVGLLLQLSGA